MSAAADQQALSERLSGGPWRVEVVDETGSTNADLAAAARAGASDGTVLVAGFQSAGRGRLTRTWVAPPETAVATSLLLRPDPQAPGWPWLTLALALAVQDALVDVAGVDARIKWPNDVLVGGRKLVGILGERVETPTGPACVLGCGINLTLAEADLPVPTATSLALAGAATTDRVAIVAGVLARFEARYRQWRDADPGLRGDFLTACESIGRRVRVLLPDQADVEGIGVDIDAIGRLVVDSGGLRRAFAVGDVEHLR